MTPAREWTGVVTTDAGEAVPHTFVSAGVEAERVGGVYTLEANQAQQTRSGEDGSFQLSDIPPTGTIVFLAVHGKKGGRVRHVAQPEKAEIDPRANLVLDRQWQVQGNILGDGLSVRNAHLSLLRVEYEDRAGHRGAVVLPEAAPLGKATDGGAFELYLPAREGFTPVATTIEIEAPRFVRTRATLSLALKPNQPTLFDIPLEREKTLSGDVVDERGLPVDGAWVVCGVEYETKIKAHQGRGEGVISATQSLRTVTDAGGQYRIEGLVGPCRKAMVGKTGYKSQMMDFVPLDESRRFTLKR
jgi:hypothetical protein